MTARHQVGTLQRLCNITDRVISSVQPSQLRDPTPCSEWTVEQLVKHIVGSTDFFAEAAEHGAVTEDRQWPGYSPSELLPAYRQQSSRLIAAFSAPDVMDRPMRAAAGPATAYFCIEIAESEQLVHAWDLAVAIGHSFDDDVSDIAEALLASPEYVGVNTEVRLNSPPPLGPEQTTDASATALERLVAFLGRDPCQAK